MDGWMERWMHAWKDGWIDEWMDGKKASVEREIFGRQNRQNLVID